jgi:hypothetical protein
LVAVNNVESEDEYSDNGDFDSEYHPSDNADSGSAVLREFLQPKLKMNQLLWTFFRVFFSSRNYAGNSIGN